MLGLDLARVSSSPAWWSEGASFAADFVNDRYMRNGLSISRNDALSVTRATPKLAVDSQGHWHTFPANTLARTDLGALVEPAATNYVHNSAMVGAILGTPGTAPTGWTIPTNSNGLARQIVDTGMVDGLPYIDIRFFGTTTAESFVNIELVGSNFVAASNSEDWAFSCFIALVAGSLDGLVPHLACRLRVAIRNSGGSYLGELISSGPQPPTPEIARMTQSAVIANASAGAISPYLQMWYQSNSVVDLTIRLAAPQLERGVNPSSPILTSGIAMSRAPDQIETPEEVIRLINTEEVTENVATPWTPSQLQLLRSCDAPA